MGEMRVKCIGYGDDLCTQTHGGDPIEDGCGLCTLGDSSSATGMSAGVRCHRKSQCVIGWPDKCHAWDKWECPTDLSAPHQSLNTAPSTHRGGEYEVFDPAAVPLGSEVSYPARLRAEHGSVRGEWVVVTRRAPGGTLVVGETVITGRQVKENGVLVRSAYTRGIFHADLARVCVKRPLDEGADGS